MIGRVDDDGVFSQPVFVERRHDSPDRVIDQRCLGKIVAKARGVIQQQQRAGETVMWRAAGLDERHCALAERTESRLGGGEGQSTEVR